MKESFSRHWYQTTKKSNPQERRIRPGEPWDCSANHLRRVPGHGMGEGTPSRGWQTPEVKRWSWDSAEIPRKLVLAELERRENSVNLQTVPLMYSIHYWSLQHGWGKEYLKGVEVRVLSFHTVLEIVILPTSQSGKSHDSPGTGQSTQEGFNSMVGVNVCFNGVLTLSPKSEYCLVPPTKS